MSNCDQLSQLFEKTRIDLGRGHVFNTPPQPMPPTWDFGFVEGMMLGLAMGDALGNPTEGWLPGDRKRRYGEIQDYLPVPHAGGLIGLPSDDTQLAFWTLEQLLEDGYLDIDHLADRLCRGRIFGIGATVKDFIGHRKAGLPWHQCGPKSAGNGALMRIAPIVVPHLRSPTSELWCDAALAAMLTHNDSASTASCLSFVNMIWLLLAMKSSPMPEWWLETFVEVAKDLEMDYSYRPRGGAFVQYEGPVWRFVEDYVGSAFHQGLSVAEACDQWYSGAYLLETMPCVIYILMKHGDNPEEAITRAVNDTRDNDTIAAIVGAAMGALYGKESLPERWKAGLLGRTREEEEDGHVFRLLEQARQVFWEDSLASRSPEVV